MEREKITLGTITKKALALFPFLKRQLQEVFPAPEAELLDAHYVFFGSVFSYYMREYRSFDENQMKQIGDFVEHVAQFGDGYVEDLLNIEVLPVFLEDQEITDAYWPYLGEKTRKLLDIVNVYLGMQVKLPS